MIWVPTPLMLLLLLVVQVAWYHYYQSVHACLLLACSTRVHYQQQPCMVAAQQNLQPPLHGLQERMLHCPHILQAAAAAVTAWLTVAVPLHLPGSLGHALQALVNESQGSRAGRGGNGSALVTGVCCGGWQNTLRERSK